MKQAPQRGARTRKSIKKRPLNGKVRQPGKIMNSHPEPEPAKTASPADAVGAGGNVDKIRDILFGSHIKDYETRFGRLEESLVSQTVELRESTKRRLDGLETYLKDELEALQSRLKSEREDRSTAVKQLSREVKELGDALHTKLREIEDHGSESDRRVREQILQQSKQLLAEIQARQAEVTSLVERRSQDLASTKTDRAMLAALLTEVAMRLNDEFHIPGSEG